MQPRCYKKRKVVKRELKDLHSQDQVVVVKEIFDVLTLHRVKPQELKEKWYNNSTRWYMKEFEVLGRVGATYVEIISNRTHKYALALEEFYEWETRVDCVRAAMLKLVEESLPHNSTDVLATLVMGYVGKGVDNVDVGREPPQICLEDPDWGRV